MALVLRRFADIFLVLWPDGRRSFYQVTVLEEVSRRRAKILDQGFPADGHDAILGYKGGRDRHFRVFHGPTFEAWTGDCWRPIQGARLAEET